MRRVRWAWLGLLALGCDVAVGEEATGAESIASELNAVVTNGPGVSAFDPRESCDGRCGGSAPSGCLCSSNCGSLGNCCADYAAQCGACLVGDRNWRELSVLPGNIPYYDRPVQVALADNGDGYAVWSGDSSDKLTTFVRIAHRSGGAWAPTESFVAPSGGGAYVAVGHAGDAFVYGDGLALYNDGSGWSNVPSYHNPLEAVVDGSGNVMLIHDTGGRLLASLFSSATRAWGAAFDLGANSQSAYLQLAANDSGTFAAAWNDSGIRTARFSPGSGWGQLPLAASSGRQPVIELDDAGTIYVAWLGSSQGGVHVRRAFGATWGASQLVSTSESQPASLLRLAVNRSGEAVLAWSQGSSVWAATFSNYSPYSIASPSWAAPTFLHSGGAIDAGIDDCGARQVLIDRGTSPNGILSYSLAGPGIGWSASTLPLPSACWRPALYYTYSEAATAANGVTIALASDQNGSVCAGVWE
jgi:hypothetical protein